jgi:hypothetical protein
MGLRERVRQVGEGFARRREKRLIKRTVEEHKKAKIEKQKKELAEKRVNQGKVRQLMIDVDRAVDLKGQLSSVKDFLNGHRPDGLGKWELVEISGLVGTQGAHGFALIRENTEFKEGMLAKSKRYSYIFVGRYFKGKEMKVGEGEEAKKKIVWDVSEESIENLTIRAGETARFYNINRAVSSKRQIKRIIMDDSPLQVDHYVAALADKQDASKISIATRLQVAVGKVADVKQNMGNISWRKSARDNIHGEIMRFVQGVEAYNQKLGESSKSIRRWHIYRG